MVEAAQQHRRWCRHAWRVVLHAWCAAPLVAPCLWLVVIRCCMHRLSRAHSLAGVDTARFCRAVPASRAALQALNPEEAALLQNMGDEARRISSGGASVMDARRLTADS